MKLQPKRPPGRVDRKAAAYAADIAELRGAGYTYAAIREALLDVGVMASTSALRREVQRLRRRDLGSALHPAPGPPQCARSEAAAPRQSPPPAFDVPAPNRQGGTRGRDVAEAFFSAHLCNPLLKSQEPP
jgi:hypothetical protein